MQPIQNPSGINPFNIDVSFVPTQLPDSLELGYEKILEMFENLKLIDPKLESEKYISEVEKVENHVKSLSLKTAEGDTKKNELLNNLSSIKLGLKSFAYLKNPDVLRRGKTGTHICNLFDKGTLSLTSRLAKADEIVAPFGVAKYTAEERENRLQQIAFLKTATQQKNISPGCSLILNLIADELRESYLAIQSKICSNQQAKAVFGAYKVNIECLIGIVSIGAMSLGRFNAGLNVQTAEITTQGLQTLFVLNRRFFLTDEGFPLQHSAIIQKILLNTPEGKRCLNALNLLEDFVTQEMHRLFAPISDSLDLSEHYLRLGRRADCFLRVLNDEEGISLISSPLIKKYSVLLNRQTVSLKEFCNTIIPEITKLENKKDHKALAELWRNLGALHDNFGKTTNRTALIDELGLELKKNPNDIQLHVFSRLCLRLKWSHQSLLDEIYFIMMTNLIEASHVTNSEVDACIENLIDVTKSMISLTIENIELRFMNLPQDSGLKETLLKIWQVDFKQSRVMFFLPAIQQLEIRLERCRKNPNDQTERALTLRDALRLFGDAICTANDLLDEEMIHFRSTLLIREEENSELLKLHQDIYDLISMQREGIIAAIEGIKSLIGRCFSEIESYGQIEDEKIAKSFDLQSLRARQAGDELVKSQKTPVKKKKNEKKRVSNLQTASAKEKPQPKQLQKTQPQIAISSPKGLTVDRTQKSTMAEGNKVQAKQTTPKNQTESVFENLQETFVGLLQCEKLLNLLKDSQVVKKDCWQYIQIQNFEFLIESLMETAGKEEFSVDLTFEQTDLLRRSVEVLLGIVTVFTEKSHDEVKSIGHDTEKLLCVLMGTPAVPENIRRLLWKMRNVPISLADGNRCVNYPAEANAKQERLSDDGRQLISFLTEVEHEGRAELKSKISRMSLTNQLNHTLQRGVYFMERLLTAILDPSKLIDGELPVENLQSTQELDLVNSEASSLEGLTENKILSEDALEDKLKIFTISSREEALLAIDTALVWIGIRCMAPVEGYPLLQWRTDERNIALRNSGIYLRRLKEKLGPDRNLRPMSTILGQCQLMRRCQKELIIAALYHTDSFVDGQHIVQARDIRFENSPCVLMSILRNVSTCSKELPSIGNWMHRAHNILSYPASQGQKEENFSASQLQNFIIEVRQASRELRQFSPDETLVLGNGKLKTPEKRLQERIDLVKANESERIFPGLAAFLHTLKYGLSLPKHKYLNSNK